MHHDDSDVTLNVCLGKVFEGATLSFCGGFGQKDHRRHIHTYRHRIGRAIIHLGSHRHGADDIISGERYSLIMWNKGTFRETEAYKAVHSLNLHGADEGEPDRICLSYTHGGWHGRAAWRSPRLRRCATRSVDVDCHHCISEPSAH